MELALQIIERFYADAPELHQVLMKHSSQVRAKALLIAENSALPLDPEVISNGAMLHDIGIICCHAPDIFCFGELPYIVHGIAGAGMLRKLDPALEPYARICERHTGSGLTAAGIIASGLPLPHRDHLPETPEEKLICLADKFFSKSGKMAEKPLGRIRASMEKFGEDSVFRFDELCRLFGVTG